MVEELLQLDDRVLALVRKRWRWEGSGELAEDNEVGAVFLREGRIGRWRPFSDRGEALRKRGSSRTRARRGLRRRAAV